MCWCLQRRPVECRVWSVVQSYIIMFTLYWSLWMMRGWYDQWRTTQLTLTLPFLFVLSVGQPWVAPAPVGCPGWFISPALLCSLVSGPFTTHILFHVDLRHNWSTSPVQGNFHTFNCSWCVRWLDTRGGYQYLYQCDIDVSLELHCPSWLTAKWR